MVSRENKYQSSNRGSGPAINLHRQISNLANRLDRGERKEGATKAMQLWLCLSDESALGFLDCPVCTVVQAHAVGMPNSHRAAAQH
jgi:hypothetical protein